MISGTFEDFSQQNVSGKNLHFFKLQLFIEACRNQQQPVLRNCMGEVHRDLNSCYNSACP